MKKQQTSKDALRFLFGLWRLSPIFVWSMIIVQIVFAVLTTTIAPIFVSQLLTGIANGNATMTNSMWLLISYGVTLFIGDVVLVRITIAMVYFSESRMQAIVASRVFKYLTTKSVGYHANRISGGIVSDANKLNGSIERFWDTLIFTVVPIISTLIAVCTVLSFIIWQFAIMLLIFSIVIIIVIIRTQIAIVPTSRLSAEKSSTMTAFLADSIGNISTVKAFAREELELNKYNKLIQTWRKTNLKEMKNVLIATGIFGLMMNIMNICAFIAAVFATEYHIANIGTIYLVITYTLNVVAQLWNISKITRNYIRVIGDAGPMINTLAEPIELNDPLNPLPLMLGDGKVEFKKVTFTHDENSEKLFDEFSLIIKPGEKIGLVGKSGSGKTSLAHLLLRFSDVDSGKILLNNQNIKSITQSDLHNMIAYVSQDPTLFHRTLRENIIFGKLDATDKEIYNATRKANALDFIKSLPKGFDTLVGERGIKLSGGQRQRIAIARAILKNAPILLLDEATSALDSENEKLIQDALSKLMENRTSIVIAHRLSTIAKLDRIIVLDNGKIAEQGTHNDLLKKNGIYTRLWSHQSGKFIEEEQ